MSKDGPNHCIKNKFLTSLVLIIYETNHQCTHQLMPHLLWVLLNSFITVSFFISLFFFFLLPLSYISFFLCASACSFLASVQATSSFFCHWCHLYFHVNTWIKDRNHNRFFLCGQDATAVKVTFVYCCALWCFRSQLFPCFWHPNIWAPDNELKMATGPLSGAPSKEIIYRSASCGVLAAFPRLAMSSEPHVLSLSEFLPRRSPDPHEWKQCCVYV